MIRPGFLHFTLATALCILVSWSTAALAIVGGESVKHDDWPAAVAIGSLSQNCSAMAVGPRVLLSAADCIKGVEIQAARAGSNSYQLICETQPGFDAAKIDNAPSLLLCVTDRAVFTSFEFVETRRDFTEQGAPVTMLGYGCLHRGGNGKQSPGLSAGAAKVEGVMGATAPMRILRTSGDALCFGDLGAGLLQYFQDAGTHDVNRSLVGIGFRSDLFELSFFISTGSPGFVEWAKNWAQQRKVDICGITQTRQQCASSSPPARAVASVEPSSAAELESVPMVSVSYVAGSSIRSVITATCGAVSERYVAILKANYEADGQKTLDLDARLTADGSVSLPLCATMTGGPTIETRVVQAGDSLAGYYQKILEAARKQNQYAGWMSLCPPDISCTGPDIPDAITGNLQSSYFLEVFRASNPTVSRLKAGATILLPTISAKGNAIATPAPRVSSDILPELSISDDELQSLNEDQASNEDCSAATDDKPYPYDLDALLDALMGNKRLRQETASPVRILIADSGLFDAGQSIFSTDSLDLGGSGIDALAAKIRPKAVQGEAKLSHGTQVASVALGWPILAKMKAAAGTGNIKLTIVRIYDVLRVAVKDDNGKEVLGTAYQVYGTAFDDVKAAANRGAFVVNLSFKTRNDISQVKAMSDDHNHLIVVAAGNGGPGGGEELGALGQNYYPAQYGGGQSETVITVAATQQNGELARFSNWGARWVDIAAPGCKIPVLDYARGALRPASFSGTSLAAPLVSFTAALIESESASSLSASEVRQRILAAADLMPHLVKDDKKRVLVKDGRSLNMAKALSLYEDTLEIADPLSPGHKKTIRGKVTFFNLTDQVMFDDDQRLAFTCKGDIPNPNPKIQNILKIRPGFVTPDDSTVVKLYYRDDAGTFEDLDCTPPANAEFRVRDESEERSYTFDDVVDFVRHSLPKSIE